MNNSASQRAIDRVLNLFSQPVIQNNLRGIFAEYLVTELAGPGWHHVGSSWAAWDIEHDDSTRVEVKQSAAKQTWSPPKSGSNPPRFSIRAAKGYWKNDEEWVESHGRHAHGYVFCWHAITTEDADHTCADQWEFYVVDEQALPHRQDSIGLSAIKKITRSATARTLRAELETLRAARSIGEKTQ